MDAELEKMNVSDTDKVFAQRLYPSFWIYVAFGTYCSWKFFLQLYEGEFKGHVLIWMLMCLLFIWGALSDYKNDKWIVKGSILENWYGKREPLRTYDINKIKSVNVKRRDWFWSFPWSRIEVKIAFVDRSQTKSIEPLTVVVKDYQGFIQALKAANPEILII